MKVVINADIVQMKAVKAWLSRSDATTTTRLEDDLWLSAASLFLVSYDSLLSLDQWNSLNLFSECCCGHRPWLYLHYLLLQNCQTAFYDFRYIYHSQSHSLKIHNKWKVSCNIRYNYMNSQKQKHHLFLSQLQIKMKNVPKYLHTVKKQILHYHSYQMKSLHVQHEHFYYITLENVSICLMWEVDTMILRYWSSFRDESDELQYIPHTPQPVVLWYTLCQLSVWWTRAEQNWKPNKNWCPFLWGKGNG